jgi:hypothetical protein
LISKALYLKKLEAWQRGDISDAQFNAWHARALGMTQSPAKGPARLKVKPRQAPPWQFARIPELALCDVRLNGWPRGLLGILLRLARGRDEVEAFIDQLADLLGCCSRSVQRAQRRLEACGYLVVHHRRAPRSQGGRGSVNDPNLYEILPPAVAVPRRRSGDKSVTPRGFKIKKAA